MVSQGNYISPSISLTAFNCPHCSVLTTQFWSHIYSESFERNSTPNVIKVFDEDDFEKKSKHNEFTEDVKLILKDYFKNKVSLLPFFEKNKDGKYVYNSIDNLYVSKCYNCSKISIWVADKLIWPDSDGQITPNPDLPRELTVDYNEAASIVNKSPRGAAALLRLTIQKLCKHLGEKGKNIDEDIKSLVSKGLDPRVQKMLDTVRVIGNEAVHPGTIDLKDDINIAQMLFQLINMIVDITISQPKHIDEMYNLLPEEKRKGIEIRDRKKDQ